MSHKSHRQNARSPNHVAIIMDGNGRWATSQGKTRFAGHRAGTIHINDIVRAFAEHGVKYLTIFAFSTENWGRPKREVDALISLIHSAVLEQTETLHEQGVKINGAPNSEIILFCVTFSSLHLYDAKMESRRDLVYADLGDRQKCQSPCKCRASLQCF